MTWIQQRRLALLAASIAVALLTAWSLTAVADAHKLSVSRAKQVLKPVVEEIGNELQAELQRDPATAKVTVTRSRVTECARKTSHRVDCKLELTLQGPSDPDPATGQVQTITIVCTQKVKVSYKGKRSRKIRISQPSEPKCVVPIT
jgi:hypothetical protein